jgi:hypothetical protein
MGRMLPRSPVVAEHPGQLVAALAHQGVQVRRHPVPVPPGDPRAPTVARYLDPQLVCPCEDVEEGGRAGRGVGHVRVGRHDGRVVRHVAAAAARGADAPAPQPVLQPAQDDAGLRVEPALGDGARRGRRRGLDAAAGQLAGHGGTQAGGQPALPQRPEDRVPPGQVAWRQAA